MQLSLCVVWSQIFYCEFSKNDQQLVFIKMFLVHPIIVLLLLYQMHHSNLISDPK